MDGPLRGARIILCPVLIHPTRYHIYVLIEIIQEILVVKDPFSKQNK